MKEILINKELDKKQILLLEDGELKEKYTEADNIVRIEGNMYVGEVKDNSCIIIFGMKEPAI